METGTRSEISKNRWLILFNVITLTFMATLDSSIVNVALPQMAHKLSVSMAAIEWVVTSYLIVICASILLFGRLGDIFGKMRIFRLGMACFTVGSLLCGISTTLPMLIFARVIQAIGAAGTMSTNQGIITQVFPPHERGRALGTSGAAVALGTMVGPPLGGIIVASLSWQFIFLINIPIGLFAWIWSQKNLNHDGPFQKEPVDLAGASLFMVAIVALFGCLTQGQTVGFEHPLILGGLLLSMVAFSGFLVLEGKVKAPILQLSIFQNRLFSLSIFTGFISFIAISSSNIILPFYLQDVMKLTPEVTGFYMMVMPLIMVIVAPISGYLSDKIGSEALTLFGLLFGSIGLFLMSTLTQHSYLVLMAGFLAVLSLGNGLFQSPNTSLIMSTVPKHKLGIAGGVNALIRNLGMVFGITLSTSLLYNRMSARLGYRVADYIPGRDDVFIYGMHYVYLTAGIICLFGTFLTAYRLYNQRFKKHPTADELSEENIA